MTKEASSAGLNWTQTRSLKLNWAQTRPPDLSPGRLCATFRADSESGDEGCCSGAPRGVTEGPLASVWR
eukprot:12804720-Alexandrium_andersonii.AAC.1